MKKRYFFCTFLLSSIILLNSCVVTDYINKLFNKDNTKPPVEAPENPDKPKTTTTPEKPAEPVKPAEIKKPDNLVFAEQLQALLQKGDIDGAISLFNKMPKKLEKDEDLQMLLASLYISKGEYDNAVAVARKVLEWNPKNTDALELIAIASRASGNKQAYQNAAKELLAADPNNAQANIMVGEDYLLKRKYKLALSSYQKALQSEPDNEDALYGYALSCYYTNDVKTAKTKSLKVLEMNENHDEAMALLAKIYGEENNYAKSVELIQKAIQLDPYNYNYNLEYGLYQNYRNQLDEAEKAWKKCVTIDPDYFLGYAYLAGLYDNQNKFEEALTNYEKVIQLYPEYYFAYESAAILQYHLKQYDKARKNFEIANKYFNNYSYQLMSAACYFKQNKVLEAKKIVQAAMKPMDRNSTEYLLVRFFNDSYSKNAEVTLTQKIQKEDNSTKRGKMLFYMGLYYEINGFDELAAEYYTKVAKMQAPMFFEYRLAEWGIKE